MQRFYKEMHRGFSPVYIRCTPLQPMQCIIDPCIDALIAHQIKCPSLLGTQGKTFFSILSQMAEKVPSKEQLHWHVSTERWDLWNTWLLASYNQRKTRATRWSCGWTLPSQSSIPQELVEEALWDTLFAKNGVMQSQIRAYMGGLTVTPSSVPGSRWILEELKKLISWWALNHQSQGPLC